ncbi:MAG: hypothetical protein E7051_02995 [Lentisphaerae bacterium]|nr:hypothetical protein [Lentisphaerota bacterium]MBQ4328410.1 hypothetical protein [Lentisphaeria bacterium]
MKNFILFTMLATAVALLCGCEDKKHTPPPMERVSLVVRFFNSMKYKDSSAAVRQGQNIFSLDRSQNNVRTLIHIQESNEAVVEAQKLIDSGNINGALGIIVKTLALYPQNNTLENARAKLRQLRNAEQLLAAMQKARSSSAMSSARSAAETGLSRNMTPQLQKYFENYKLKEAKQAEFERKHTANSLEAASAAAEKAKAEDAAREAENIRFMQAMAEKTAIGEQMRKDAGEVPFEPDAGMNNNEKK